MNVAEISAKQELLMLLIGPSNCIGYGTMGRCNMIIGDLLYFFMVTLLNPSV